MPTNSDQLADELIEAVETLSDVFAEKSIRYAMIGGLATLLRGRPRFTQDVDILLEVPQVSLPALLEALAERGFTFDMTVVIREFVSEHFTRLQYGEIRIDWLKPVLPLYSNAIRAASPIVWTEGHTVNVAQAEGLILMKLIAFRPQDQIDIETLMVANRGEIDLQLIRTEWSAIADGEDERTAWLEAAIARNVPLA